MKTAILALSLLCISARYATAKPSPLTGCYNSPADIVFILDSSASIWPPDFRKQILFVQNVTKEFDIGTGDTQTRVGILTFGHIVWPQFNLNQYMDDDYLQKAIGKIKQKYGRRTNTGDAIEYAVSKMFLPENGHREGVSKIAVVITDGRSQNVYKTNSAAADAHKHNITVFAIGVGKRLDYEELRQIASDPDSEHFFNVTNYSALLEHTLRFAELTCKVTVAPTLPPSTTEMPITSTPDHVQDSDCEGKPADIFFIIDGSSSITRKNFNKELDFLEKVVEMFDIGETKTRVGMLTFANDAKMLIGLDNKMSKETLLSEILKIKHIYGGTNTGAALRMARQEGFARNIVRKNVAKIAIVLTDGLSADEDETVDEAKKNHFTGIKTFAIGIGSGYDLKEIKAIASDPDDEYVYQVEDFNSLDSIKDFLVNKACAEQPDVEEVEVKDEPACPVKKNTDVMFIYDSASLGEVRADAISQFIASIVSQLDVSSGFLHLGRMTENCPSGANFDLSSKVSAIDFANIRLATYSTLVKKVHRTGFSAEYGGRGNAEKVGILFVDANSDMDHDMLEEAKKLANVSELFLIAIGDTPALDNFSAEFKRRNVIQINSYKHLDSYVNALLTKFCYHLRMSDYTIDYVVPL